MNKKISEKTSQIEKLEEKYLNDKIPTDLFEKYSSKYQAELNQLLVENDQNEFSSSNLEKAVKKGLEIAENLIRLH